VKKVKIKKIYIILSIIVLIVIIIGGLLGHYFYRNLHPVDEKYLKQTMQAGFNEKKATLTDGSVINYGEGPSNGPALLLIHGQNAAWEDYASVLPELSKKFHVFAVDCYGHGKSSHDPALYSCEANGKALIWFMENVIGEKCFVSGHSSGGILTAWLAANAPEQVKGIVLEDPPLFEVTPQEMQEGKACFAWKDTFETIHSFLNQKSEADYAVYYAKHSYMTSLFGGGVRDKFAQSVENFRKAHPGQTTRICWFPYAELRMDYADEYDLKFGEVFYDGSWMKDVDQESMLKNIKCPTIYLKAATNYGKDGVLYAANSDEDAKKVQKCISNCETITIKSGHDIHYEHPDVFISAFQKLLKKAG
jgi:pimeloyl-ACP methyl ester carboxylesterase